MTAIRRDRKPNHPGAILLHHYMVPRAVSIDDLANVLDISPDILAKIVEGCGRIDPLIAARLAATLGTSTQFWLNLQGALDAWDADRQVKDWQPSRRFLPPAENLIAHPAE